MKKMFLSFFGFLVLSLVFSDSGFFSKIGFPAFGPKVASVGFEDKLITGNPIDISHRELSLVVFLLNASGNSQDFLVSAKIWQGKELEYFFEEKVGSYPLKEPMEIKLSKAWFPKHAGTHKIKVEIFSVDKKNRFDEFNYSIELFGEKDHAVDVSCPQKILMAGQPVESAVRVKNFGNFAETIALNTTIKNRSKQAINSTDLSFALGPKQTKEFQQKIYLPDNSFGYFELVATAITGNKHVSDNCVFIVENRSLVGDVIRIIQELFGV